MCWLALILGLTGGMFAGIRIGALFCELTHVRGPGPGREGG